MSEIDISRYGHSLVHRAVITRDYTALKRIIDSLPKLCKPTDICTEADSVREEEKADAISAVIDSRNVPNKETPLHLAVKLGDLISTEMLMIAGADWSLHNDQGWSPLQEAICLREEVIAMIIVRHYQPLAWAKWCRRLPRLIGTMRRMRDFYMEITFHFESSVIPFISRIAPSDTYKIWKKGANLRADLTLAGFDGFRIQRADQSILFLGDGSENGKVLPGSLLMISHKEKEVMNALDGLNTQSTEAEIKQEVEAMSRTNIFRPGIDVTQAVLVPQLTWRKQEKTEVVGTWKSKVYDMHHVVVSVKSRCVPGAMIDDDLISSCNDNDTESEDYEELLTDEERRQLEGSLNMDSLEMSDDGSSIGVTRRRHSCYEEREITIEDTNGCESGDIKQERKGWFGSWERCSTKQERQNRMGPQGESLCTVDRQSDLRGISPSRVHSKSVRHSVDISEQGDVLKRGRDIKESKKYTRSSESGHRNKESGRESEYKKGLRPVLWLSPDFPLQTDELLPLLDIIANKVKAVRRLRELLTTKLPPGTFPVKVSIPVVPTIKVIVTFTKFEEIQSSEEFSTPPSSPDYSNSKGHEVIIEPQISSSWFQWMKNTNNHQGHGGLIRQMTPIEDNQDPFVIPKGYTWVSLESKKKKMQEHKNKSKKGRSISKKST